jgi:hypothetical protein
MFLGHGGDADDMDAALAALDPQLVALDLAGGGTPALDTTRAPDVLRALLFFLQGLDLGAILT